MDKVYIILVNYNNFGDTIECLESLLKSEYLNYQIFIVDNSKNELSVNEFSNWLVNNNFYVKTDFPHLVFPLQNKPIVFRIFSEANFEIQSETFEEKIIIIRAGNNGFAAANNIVLRYILRTAEATSLIWLLNNDTVVEKTTLGNLVCGYLSNLDKKYIFGSKLLCYNNPKFIQAVAGKYNKWLGKHHHIGEGEEDKSQYDAYSFGQLDYIVGASLFLPKLFLEQVGLMNEDYFLYFEELDWITKGRRNGFNIALAPCAIVYHKEGSSIVGEKSQRKDTSTAEFYSISNRVRFIKKWYPLCVVTVLPGVFFALMKRMFSGKFKLAMTTSVAVCHILFSVKPPIFKYETD